QGPARGPVRSELAVLLHDGASAAGPARPPPHLRSGGAANHDDFAPARAPQAPAVATTRSLDRGEGPRPRRLRLNDVQAQKASARTGAGRVLLDSQLSADPRQGTH